MNLTTETQRHREDDDEWRIDYELWHLRAIYQR